MGTLINFKLPKFYVEKPILIEEKDGIKNIFLPFNKKYSEKKLEAMLIFYTSQWKIFFSEHIVEFKNATEIGEKKWSTIELIIKDKKIVFNVYTNSNTNKSNSLLENNDGDYEQVYWLRFKGEFISQLSQAK